MRLSYKRSVRWTENPEDGDRYPEVAPKIRNANPTGDGTALEMRRAGDPSL